MTVRNPWAQHFQRVWEERAGDPRLPQWLRVACLAYGRHAANGHAMFKPGQIGLVLGSVNRITGEVVPLDRGSVQRAIRTAVEYGWLANASGSRCLVVPGHAVQGGVNGKADAVCPQHRNVGTQRPPVPRNVGTQCPPRRHSVPTSNALTSANVTALYESSHPQPESPTQAGAHSRRGEAS